LKGGMFILGRWAVSNGACSKEERLFIFSSSSSPSFVAIFTWRWPLKLTCSLQNGTHITWLYEYRNQT